MRGPKSALRSSKRPSDRGPALRVTTFSIQHINSTVQFVGALVGIVAALFGFLSLMGPDPVLFPKYTEKGPRVTSLDFTNDHSSTSLECFLNKRYRGPAERELAKECIRDLLRNEQHTADEATLSLLFTLYGDFLLAQGKLDEAIHRFEQALEKDANNDVAAHLLVQGYRAQIQHLVDDTLNRSDIRDRLRQIGELNARIIELLERHGGDLESRREFRYSDLWQSIPAAHVPTPIEERDRASPARLAPTPPGVAEPSNPEFLQEATMALRESLTFRSTVDPYIPSLLFDEPAGTRQRTAPRARLLAAGVDDYDLEGLEDLSYAGRDARRVATVFTALGYEPTVFLGEGANRSVLLHTLEREVRRSQPGDVLVFFFSGHGITDKDGNGTLITGGGVAGAEGVTFTELSNALAGHRGEVTVIADVCLEDLGLRVTPTLSGAPAGQILDVDFYFDVGDAFGSPFPRFGAGTDNPTNITWLLAGRDGQSAVESHRRKSGLFTDILVELLGERRTQDNPWGGKTGPVFAPVDFAALYGPLRERTARAALRYGVEQDPLLLPANLASTPGVEAPDGRTPWTLPKERTFFDLSALPPVANRSGDPRAGDLVAAYSCLRKP